jgi:16S rRNA processing protein RimM
VYAAKPPAARRGRDVTVRLEVGRIGRAHGLHGEVSVAPISNRPERFAPGSTLYAGDRALVVASSRSHQQRWLVRFVGVDDRNGAEALRGRVLSGDAPDAAEHDLFVHDLIGCEVRDRDGHTIGRVAAVEANPAHDLLVLEDNTLIPMVFVQSHEHGVVVVDVPEGLLDL